MIPLIFGQQIYSRILHNTPNTTEESGMGQWNHVNGQEQLLALAKNNLYKRLNKT